MKALPSIKRVIILTAFAATTIVNGAELPEVGKGKIPAEHVSSALKTLPNGISIWDEKEVIDNLKKKGAKILWVDTRPASFYNDSTIKNAKLLLYNKDETLSDAESQLEKNILTKETLATALKEIDAEASNVTIVFFCQGPKCHRSYNAALRSVQKWGYDSKKVVWNRCGIPNLLKYIKGNSRLERRINRYLQGNALN